MLILFISIQGSFILNHLGLQHHKQSEKKATKKNIYLSFSTKEWQKVEKVNDEEIRIQGKMFDLKSIQFKQDRVVVYGHYDVKEDKLLANAKALEKKKQEQKKSASNDYHLFFEISNTTILKTSIVLSKKNYYLFSQQYFSQYRDIESPPPQVVA
ncbi:MAG TPA: hypothetical protein PKC41_00795 [Chitinophagaceae bacterium]|nr:hypothetical protein [Chitinophagaceae bacterium]